MSKSLKYIIISIGAAGLMASANQAYYGADFLDYFMGIFLGVTLIGTALITQDKKSTDTSGE
ncbi:hypothetical protein KFE98_14655 [bacterium SCSIO 12741]|nr:hypothetical protein KFE98_14655 [bacterium SCSIO 12741]